MTAARSTEDLLRELAPRALGALVRRYGDFADCEDAMQEALLAAATTWPAEGQPDNPPGWLIRVASRRLANQYRGDAARRRREALAASWSLTPPKPARGLLALMLLTDARRPARSGPGGELIPLTEQDRTRWDRDLMAEGMALITGALGRGHAGEYQVQAAIAALHDQAASPAATDWAQILTLYDLLEAMTGNPMVTLSRAVAAAMAHGPGTGLALLEGLGGRLSDHHRLHSVRAHLLEQAGDTKAAIAEFRAAAARTMNLREQHYLTTQAARVAAQAAAGAGAGASGRHGEICTSPGSTREKP